MLSLAPDTSTETAMDGDAQASIIAGHLNVQHAHAVALIAELIDTGDWAGHGIHSPEHWVKLRFGVSHGRARTLVNVARHWHDFPHTMSEFTAGGLSLEQVEVVVTRAPAWADPRLADFASALTVPQLHRVIRHEYFDPDPEEPADTGSEAAPEADPNEPEPREPGRTSAPTPTATSNPSVWRQRGLFRPSPGVPGRSAEI